MVREYEVEDSGESPADAVSFAGNPQWTFVIEPVRWITDVLEVFYLPTETRVNAAIFLRQSVLSKSCSHLSKQPG